MSSGRFLLACAALLAAQGPASIVAAELLPPSHLRERIIQAVSAGKTKVVLPAGVYRLAPSAAAAALEFEGLADFEIDARGVTLMRTAPIQSVFVFNRCRNVTLRGITLVNETPPFTQGTIVAIDPEGRWYEVRLDSGYAHFDAPGRFPSEPVGYIFDPASRQWKPGAADYYFARAERRGSELFRLHFKGVIPPASQPVAVGDLMAFRGKGSTDIRLNACAAMTIADVTIRSGSGFCVHESGGEGGNRYTFTVTYGPPPIGATSAPLISANADAFHSSGVRRGPTLERCRFEGMCDDGVAIHGSFALVAAARGRDVTVCFQHGNFFQAGDSVRFFDPEGSFVGETSVRAVKSLPRFTSEAPITSARFKSGRQFAELTLAAPVSVGFQFLASNPAANGSGYVVRDCTIRNHRARGMLLKADHGLVEGNTIEGSTLAGIVLAPELWWNEACYSRDVVIRRNLLRHTGYASLGVHNPQAGALTIGAAGERLPATPGHRQLVIADNTFEDCDGINVLVAAATDVEVRGNQFIRPQRHPSDRGRRHGVDPDALVWLSHSDDVRLSGNHVRERGPSGTPLVSATPSVRRLAGQTDGVTIASP